MIVINGIVHNQLIHWQYPRHPHRWHLDLKGDVTNLVCFRQPLWWYWCPLLLPCSVGILVYRMLFLPPSTTTVLRNTNEQLYHRSIVLVPRNETPMPLLFTWMMKGTHHPSHHHHSLPLHPSSPIPTKSLLFWANCHHQHSYIIPQQLRILGRTILMHS